LLLKPGEAERLEAEGGKGGKRGAAQRATDRPVPMPDIAPSPAELQIMQNELKRIDEEIKEKDARLDREGWGAPDAEERIWLREQKDSLVKEKKKLNTRIKKYGKPKKKAK
jgi:hypothetical protein